MTVRELVAVLQRMDQDAVVYVTDGETSESSFAVTDDDTGATVCIDTTAGDDSFLDLDAIGPLGSYSILPE